MKSSVFVIIAHGHGTGSAEMAWGNRMSLCECVYECSPFRCRQFMNNNYKFYDYFFFILNMQRCFCFAGELRTPLLLSTERPYTKHVRVCLCRFCFYIAIDGCQCASSFVWFIDDKTNAQPEHTWTRFTCSLRSACDWHNAYELHFPFGPIEVSQSRTRILLHIYIYEVDIFNLNFYMLSR